MIDNYSYLRENLIEKTYSWRWLIVAGITVIVWYLASLSQWLVASLFAYALVNQTVKHRRAHKESELRKAQLASLLDNIPHMAWFKDPGGRFLTVNQPFLNKLGVTNATSVIGKTDLELWPRDIALLRSKDERQIIEMGRRQRTERKTFSGGGEYWEEIYRSPVFSPSGELLGTTGIGLDITQRKLHEEEIRRMAYMDGLTGLPNRVHLREKLEIEMQKVRRGAAAGAILYIDIDNLKLINDTLGHTYGDDLIRTAGMCISAKAGEGSVVARVGGDEFVVILCNETEEQKICSIVDGIVKVLNRDYRVLDTSVYFAVSAGVASYPKDGETAEEILQNADLALHVAKASGKNAWRYYEPAMKKRANEKMTLKRSLRTAIDRGEMSLHYQPLITAAERKIVSFEALLRWNSAEHGQVSPAQFIPLAEEDDTIEKIGRWVLNEACQFACHLRKTGCEDIKVIVNVSPRQVASSNFLVHIVKAVTTTGVKPSQLEIEITENILIGSLEDTLQKLKRLREFGISLSLDDFGTGYSSLAYLRQLPFQTLKIDKSFIDALLSDEVQLQFISSIIGMAHILGLTVVAEGVETEKQFKQLAMSGCDRVQGYFFSRPVPQDQAIKMLARENRRIII